ncbi:MAG: L,D-transpeptidase [Acidobacteriota bacterium]
MSAVTKKLSHQEIKSVWGSILVISTLLIPMALPVYRENSQEAQSEATPAQARIVVNVPAYKLAFYRADTLVKTYPVTIGSPRYSSPYGVAEQAVEIVWNPSWTPPSSDWGRKERPARPGAANNPLGRLKIRVANLPFLIHGGGDRSLNRPVSHGCVRLRNADALELARLIIDACQLNISNKQIASFIAQRYQEHSVPIKGKVTVEFHYQTITVEDGQLHIYPDIYNEGMNTTENLIYVLYQAGIDYQQLSDEQRTLLTKALEKSGKTWRLPISTLKSDNQQKSVLVETKRSQD